MKPYFFIFALIAAIPAFSFDDFTAYRIAPCRYWIPAASGGFACQHLPVTVMVPDAKSLSEVLIEQNKRIVELEKRIVELELLFKKQ